MKLKVNNQVMLFGDSFSGFEKVADIANVDLSLLCDVLDFCEDANEIDDKYKELHDDCVDLKDVVGDIEEYMKDKDLDVNLKILLSKLINDFSQLNIEGYKLK